MWGRSRVQKVMKFSVFQPNNSWENWIFCQDNKLQKSKETNPSLQSPMSLLCLPENEPRQHLDIENQSWIDQLETGNRKPRTQSWSKISWNTTGFSEKEKRTALRNLVKNVYLLGIFSKSNMWGRSRVSGGTKVSSFHQKVKLTENAFPDFLKTTDDPFLLHTPAPPLCEQWFIRDFKNLDVSVHFREEVSRESQKNGNRWICLPENSQIREVSGYCLAIFCWNHGEPVCGFVRK